MRQEEVVLPHTKAIGYTIPLGPVNIVLVATPQGMVGCGALDVMALDRFGYPAARARPTRGESIVTVEDLLEGEIKDVNKTALKKGIRPGMPVREGLAYL